MARQGSEHSTRQSLLLRIKDGQDHQAWNEFVALYTPPIHGLCVRRHLLGPDADDVTQDVFTKIHRTAQVFDYASERGRFRDWLGRITENTITDRFRREARVKQEKAMEQNVLQQLAESGPVSPEWMEEVDNQVIRVSFARVQCLVEPEAWTIFVEYWWNDRPAKEVAEELRVSEAKVYSAKFRCLKLLKQEVKKLAEDLPYYSALD